MMPLISREDAEAQGLRRYFTGLPCMYGHISERFVRGSWCLQCSREYQRRRYNPATAKERAAAFKLTHGALVKKWHYNAHIKRAYGLSGEDFDKMLRDQGSRCAICFSVKRPGKKYGPWAVDHCHETGKVRGVLCLACNTMLGMAKDTQSVLEGAQRYLSGKKMDGMMVCASMSMGV